MLTANLKHTCRRTVYTLVTWNMRTGMPRTYCVKQCGPATGSLLRTCNRAVRNLLRRVWDASISGLSGNPPIVCTPWSYRMYCVTNYLYVGWKWLLCAVKRVKEVSDNWSTRIFRTGSVRFGYFVYSGYRSVVAKLFNCVIQVTHCTESYALCLFTYSYLSYAEKI